MKKVKKSAKVFSANADKEFELNEGDHMKAYKGFRNTVYVDYTVTEVDVECSTSVKYINGSNTVTCLVRSKLKPEIMAKMIEAFSDHYKLYPKFSTDPESYFSSYEAKYININFKGCRKEETKGKKVYEAINKANEIAEGSFKAHSIKVFIETVNRRITNANDAYKMETSELFNHIRPDYVTEMTKTSDLEKAVKEAEAKLSEMKKELKDKKNLAFLNVMEVSDWQVDGVGFTEEIKEEIRRKAKNSDYFNTSGFFHF